MHRTLFLPLLLAGCAATLVIPLFDREPLLKVFPGLEEKVHEIEDYTPPEKDPAGERWIQDDARPLRPGNRFRLHVPDEPRLCREFRIRPDGIVDLPVAGSVRTAGTTAGELKKTVHERLLPFLIRPAVGLLLPPGETDGCDIVGPVRWQKRIVSGESPVWLTGALTQAGGAIPGANPAQVIVVRPAESCAVICNLFASPVLNLPLRDGDVVVMTRLYDPDLQPFAEEWKPINDFLAGRIDRTALVGNLTLPAAPSHPEN